LGFLHSNIFQGERNAMKFSCRAVTAYVLLTVFVAATSVVNAQGAKKPLTIDAIYDDILTAPGPSQVRWRSNKELSFFYPNEEGENELWVMNTVTGEKTRLLEAEAVSRLAPPLSQVARNQMEREWLLRYRVPAYRWSPDGQTLLGPRNRQLRLHRLSDSKQIDLAHGKQDTWDPKYSPDGKTVSFVYEHDIWVVPAEGGKEKQITFGGSENLLHGDVDWIYTEELGVRTGYQWSPDGRYIAFLEMDQELVPRYHINYELTRQMKALVQHYPKPGDPNPRVWLGIVEVATGKTAWIDRRAEYIPRFQWADERTLAVQLLNRQQNKLELVFVDPATGVSRKVLTESDDAFLNVTSDLTFLGNGREFVWTSERSGFRHVYLYNRNGQQVRQLTKGKFEVQGIAGLDEEGGWVYYRSTEDSPLGSDLYRVKLRGGGSKERVTKKQGTHSVNMNGSATAFLNGFSSLEEIGQTTVNNLAAGKGLPFHQPKKPDGYDLVTPEIKELKTEDGALVRVMLLKPRRLRRGRKYPVLAYVYGMAHVPTIRNRWGSGSAEAYYFYQSLVQRGYVVAFIDDRSATIAGHDIEKLTYGRVGTVSIEDHRVAVEYLRSLPYTDGNRMAIWGWSGGGFTTGRHLTQTGLFQVGIAGAPVTDWHLYDSIYTERYMGLPAKNPEGYAETSVVDAAENLQGRLLLIHGTGDVNVHPQNTLQFMDKLIQAGKQFDVMFYPSVSHGRWPGSYRRHRYKMIADYLDKQFK
jgi:dipeptidyl-peptidase-4